MTTTLREQIIKRRYLKESATSRTLYSYPQEYVKAQEYARSNMNMQEPSFNICDSGYSSYNIESGS